MLVSFKLFGRSSCNAMVTNNSAHCLPVYRTHLQNSASLNNTGNERRHTVGVRVRVMDN